MSNNHQHVVVLVAAEAGEPTNTLARTLVEERLAACVQVVPGLTSVYTWQGQVETASEVLLVIKSRAALVERLRARVVELHPYDVPEFVALPVVAGHPPYLAWIDESTDA